MQNTPQVVWCTSQNGSTFAPRNNNKKNSKIMAQIIVNDEKQEVTLPLTLAELIKINKVFQPEMVTIQVNEDFVEKEDYETTQLKEGDRVDFLYFMGGGAC